MSEQIVRHLYDWGITLEVEDGTDSPTIGSIRFAKPNRGDEIFSPEVIQCSLATFEALTLVRDIIGELPALFRTDLLNQLHEQYVT